MAHALRRAILIAFGGVLAACSPPTVAAFQAPPAAAVVNGETITMDAYQARLKVTQARDPFAGMPEAIPSPAPTQRLEDFTIEQLIREAIIRQQAGQRGISISDQAVGARIEQLKQSAGASSFASAITRNGFTERSFDDYERTLLTEVALLQAMARQRIDRAMTDLKDGESFANVVAKFNDDPGTAARQGEVGWVRPSDLPEPALARAVDALAAGSISPVIRTNRGYVIASALDRRADQVRLAVILVLAPGVDVFSPQGTPAWFTTSISDREAALKTDGKITVRVGSHAGS